MYMKRIAKAAIVTALASSLFVMPVSAHWHGQQHHGQTTQKTTQQTTTQTTQQATVEATDTSCPVCTVEGCTEKGKHTHDGHDYCGYAHEGGYCDGTCVDTSCPVCTVDGCTEKGKHSHDGHDYCGYSHESGYCDGTCADTTTKKTVTQRSSVSRRHCIR